MPLRPRPSEHRASRAAEPVAPLEVPPKWMALAVPFAVLGRNAAAWQALRLQHELCGYCLRHDGRLVARGD